MAPPAVSSSKQEKDAKDGDEAQKLPNHKRQLLQPLALKTETNDQVDIHSPTILDKGYDWF